MKNLVLVVVFALFGSALFAQEKVVREEFYANGNLKLQFVELDQNIVKATYYFEDGGVYETGFFVNQKLDGKWTTYTADQLIQCTAYFSNNEKVGDWTFYKNGQVFQVVSFSNDQMAKN